MNDKLYKDTFSRLRTTVDETEIAVPRRRYRAVTVAVAAVLVLALAVGAAEVTAGSGRLHDLLLKRSPEQEVSDAAAPDKDGSYDPLPEGVDMISLQGYADSPEYKAMQEWSQFEHEYDTDGSILAKVGNDPTPWDEKYNYNGYRAYSQEMADKLEEIAGKYGLAFHTGGLMTADVARLEELFGDFTTAERYGGYRFEDGTFQCDCEQDGIVFQLRRTMKGVMDIVSLNVQDAAQFEQWEYETACGVTVLLALGPEHSLIFSDTEKSFVAVNILTGSVQGLTEDALQQFADTFDFSLL